MRCSIPIWTRNSRNLQVFVAAGDEVAAHQPILRQSARQMLVQLVRQAAMSFRLRPEGALLLAHLCSPKMVGKELDIVTLHRTCQTRSG
jgi:hypothetical protein